MSTRLGKKSMVGWIGAVRPSRRPLSRPPQDEELSQCHQSPILILRSAQRARLEGRKAAMQPRRLNSCPASTQILPAASLRSADRLPAARGLLQVSNRLISIALWSIGRVIFRVASNFLPALRERRAWPHGMANPILASDMAGSEVMSHEAVRHRSAGPPRPR